MAVFTFSINGRPSTLDLIGISGDDIEAAIRRMRVIFGEDFSPVGLRSTGADAPHSLKIDSSGAFSDRFGNVISPQDFISGAITRSAATDPRAGGVGGVGGIGASTTIIGEEGRGMAGGADVEGVPLSEANRFASFLRNLGQRGFQQGTLGRTIQEKRYDPARSAFFGEEALAGLQTPDRTPGTFETFLGGVAPGLTGLGGRARSAFGSLADLTGASPGLTPERQGAISQFTNPDFAGSNIGDQLVNLALQSARSSFAPIISNQLFRNDRFTPVNLQSQFQAGLGTAGLAGQGQGDFVNFLRSRFGQ